MSYRIVLTDISWRKFLPITKTRPLADIRAGAFTFVERVGRLFPDSSICVLTRPGIVPVFETKADIATQIPDGTESILLLDSNVVYDIDFRETVTSAKPGSVFLVDEEPVAALLETEKIPENLNGLDYDRVHVDMLKIRAIWDLVNINGQAIEKDFREHFLPEKKGEIHKSAVLYNPDDIFIGEYTQIGAGAVLDAREGPIIIQNGSVIAPNVVIAGPCYIGEDCVAVSGWIRTGCSFGPVCRIGGEIESTIFQGYSNKYHEGFIGHSYIGQWVNLGALTTNSDLKNNYSEIRVDFGDGPISTGRIKVGCFIGDHTKTGIGTLINSGTCMGVSVNHYGVGLAPKYIPDFSWGTADSYTEYDIEKAIATARIVMSRRGKELLAEEERLLRSIHRQRNN